MATDRQAAGRPGPQATRTVSFVCVFNDAAVFHSHLRSSVERQSVPCELVAVDNRDGTFPGAAAALNHGGARAAGDWVVFAHQDVVLLSPDWAADALGQLGDGGEGWYGVVGRSGQGTAAGFLLDRAALVGAPSARPRPVQTLDECVLIHRRRPGGAYFDEGVPGWHAYGVEACCTALRAGHANAVLSLPTWHDSKAVNAAGLGEAHAYVWAKHRGHFRAIYTTVGNLGKPRRERWAVWPRLRRRAVQVTARAAGFPTRYVHLFPHALEELTAGAPRVAVLHPRQRFGPIRADGFVQSPPAPRQVVHHFDGLIPRPDGLPVLTPELGAGDPRRGDVRRALADFPDLVVVLPARDWLRHLGFWRSCRRRVAGPVLLATRQDDGGRLAVLLRLRQGDCGKV